MIKSIGKGCRRWEGKQMIDVKPDGQSYKVGIYEPNDVPEGLVFTFIPNGLRQAHGAGELPRRATQYMVLVKGSGDAITFDWSRSPEDPGAARPELEREARERVNVRAAWLRLVSDLVAQVEQWGQELGWATRRIEKRLEDSQIGKHPVPALLLQEGTCRVLLEPVGRSAPGADGVVDLYRMPAYDDIASLYFYGNRWNLHALSLGGPVSATARQAAGVPLSKESLQRVLEELKQHAA
jgi:hypothetical protein